ncbi:MAG: radical SAM protein [Anaerolineales bacterium]|nr:radical SAM protein [Anaerolineales bacterium]
MITETHTKGILNPVKQPDDWFGLKYNMNLYRGCQHRCIYCDSRSECYQIENFDSEVIVKINAVDLLADSLPRKRIRGTIGTGSMNDPYMPVEKQYNLTGGALQVIAKNQFPVHVLTKSDLVLKDLDTLVEINKTFAAVSFTVTTADDDLGKKLEPGAPKVSRRFQAMAQIAGRGIYTGVLLMPLLPMIEDNSENVGAIIQMAADHGASYLLPSFGLTMRDRQREYLYQQLDQHFPGLSTQYRQKFGLRYFAPADDAQKLYDLTREVCDKFGINLSMPKFTPEKISSKASQMKLF